jgi:hypothetical protein
MNDDHRDMEQRFGQLTPRRAGAELRGQVLDAVAGELGQAAARRRQRRAAMVVAASIVLGIVLNVWVGSATDRRLARLYGPTPVPKPIADVTEAVASVTDAETARQVQQRLLAAWQSQRTALPHGISSFPYHTIDFEDWLDEATQKDHDLDRDRPRRGDRRTSGGQRHSCLDHEFTA